MEEQKQEPPVLPVGSATDSSGASGGDPGVHVRVDEAWHVSNMPEERQYFSQDVGGVDG